MLPRLTITALAAGLLVPGVGCEGHGGPEATYALTLSWSFADGRSCADAGALYVTVTAADGTGTRLICADGLEQPLAAGPTVAGPLVIEAITEDLVPVYRARATMPAAAATLAVTLVYVGGG